MKVSIITNYEGMNPFVERKIDLIMQLFQNDINIAIIDYGSWAVLNEESETKKTYTGSIILTIQKIPLIRRYLKCLYPKLLNTMIRDVGVVDYCYILYVHPYVV